MVSLAEDEETEVPDLERDAEEFGQYHKQGSWRLGLLVARNCKHGTSEPNRRTRSRVDEKLSLSEFSEKAKVPKSTVAYYYKAWEYAAEAGLVLHAAELAPGDTDAGVTELEEEDEEQREKWRVFYRKARQPKKKRKPTDPPPSSSEQPSGPTEPVAERRKPTAEELAEVEATIRKEKLLANLETLRAVHDWANAFGLAQNEEEARLAKEIAVVLEKIQGCIKLSSS